MRSTSKTIAIVCNLLLVPAGLALGDAKSDLTIVSEPSNDRTTQLAYVVNRSPRRIRAVIHRVGTANLRVIQDARPTYDVEGEISLGGTISGNQRWLFSIESASYVEADGGSAGNNAVIVLENSSDRTNQLAYVVNRGPRPLKAVVHSVLSVHGQRIHDYVKVFRVGPRQRAFVGGTKSSDQIWSYSVGAAMYTR
jgi:hypothetical protein